MSEFFYWMTHSRRHIECTREWIVYDVYKTSVSRNGVRLSDRRYKRANKFGFHKMSISYTEV